ncbi:serine hydrolase domain-containing protein [Luethyella okanaganae]|uniref:Serine hydrolase domain-containing protein n=1 Tax=Luethyella okanaganae TaxID=69372 RepID=A0ABW1VH70_9MICO
MGKLPKGIRRIASFALVVVAMLGVSACTMRSAAAPGPPPQADVPLPPEVSDRLDATLAEAMELAGASGAIAGVWAPWAGEWVVSPGTTTLDGSAPLSPDMRFRIASNTKSMTCTVLLRLADEGVVALSDLVSKHLPRLAGLDGITLGHLCQNTSGLADYFAQLGAQFVNNPEREWSPMELLSNGLASPRIAAPGKAWSYSNTGFAGLGMALQAATGKDWKSLYKQYIFDPLDMSDTSFPDPTDMDMPGAHPHGYAAAVNPDGTRDCSRILDETQLSNSMGWVAGGAVSTIEDLKIWVQSLATGSLLSEESAKAQWSTVGLGGDAPSWQRYGLGALQLGPLRGHDGEIPGFISTMLSDPESGLTVVVMLNNSTAGDEFAQTVALQLASIASKAPAVSGRTAPVIELPWSVEQTNAALKAAAVCQPAPAG